MARSYLSAAVITTILVASAAFAEKPCTPLEQGKSVVLKLDPATVYVRDGDTIEERKGCKPGLRLSDVDAPETQKKLVHCQPERDRGEKATVRLTELIREAKTVEFQYSGKSGGWERGSGKLIIDGKSAGDILKKEGLGCRRTDEMEHDWCVTPPKCDARPKHAEN